jgi:cytochrome c oxidase subunit 1
MTVLAAMSIMWMGVIYHHYPIMTGRKLDDTLGYWSAAMLGFGTIAAALAMLAGGAAGMPRRHADWAQGDWMIYGDLTLVFGLIIGVGYLVYFYNMMSSRQVEAVVSPETVFAPSGPAE